MRGSIRPPAARAAASAISTRKAWFARNSASGVMQLASWQTQQIIDSREEGTNGKAQKKSRQGKIQGCKIQGRQSQEGSEAIVKESRQAQGQEAGCQQGK